MSSRPVWACNETVSQIKNKTQKKIQVYCLNTSVICFLNKGRDWAVLPSCLDETIFFFKSQKAKERMKIKPMKEDKNKTLKKIRGKPPKGRSLQRQYVMSECNHY
jgi:hypothetical protein